MRRTTSGGRAHEQEPVRADAGPAGASRHQVTTWTADGAVFEHYANTPGPAESTDNHIHEDYQFCLGRGVASLYQRSGSRTLVAPNKLVVICPGEVHSAADAEARRAGSSYALAYLPSSVLEDVAVELGAKRSLARLVSGIVGPGALSQGFARLHATTRDAPRLVQDVAIRSWLEVLLQGYGSVALVPGKGGREKGVHRAREYIHARPSEAIGLSELAAVAGLTPSHFSRSFSSAFGVPPHRYQLILRIDRARRELARGVPSADLAVALGFTDQSRFIRYFRRFTGTTPGRYRSLFRGSGKP